MRPRDQIERICILPHVRLLFKAENFFQCLLTVLEGKEHDERHERQLHDNEAFENDEGIAESGM